jgi:peptidoglycan biosynthesis protein MviN/MurJ (putative lipid II flippase)
MKWLDLVWQLGEAAASTLVQQGEQWRWQLLQSLLMIVLAAVCGLAVLVLVAGLALLQYWDTHRTEVLWVLLLGYAVLGVWLARRVGRVMTVPSRRSRRERCCSCSEPDARRGGGCRAGS